MAQNTTFKVSKRGMEPVEVNFSQPESVDDPRWEELVPEGKDVKETINTLATQALVVRIQSGARNHLPDAEAVQQFVDNYRLGVRGAGGARSKPKLAADQVKKAKFSEAQLAMLREAGMVIEGLD